MSHPEFHHQFGDTFVLPEAKVQEETMYIPGTDGEKMSKSKGNLINLFQTDKKLRKQVMGILTDSTPNGRPPKTLPMIMFLACTKSWPNPIKSRK